MNPKVAVKCDECEKIFYILQHTSNRRYEKFNKNLCFSCGQKGERNPIFNKKSNISYKQRHSKINVICEECENTFTMTYERVIMRKDRYKRNLCLSCSKRGELNPFFDRRFSQEQISLLSTIRKAYYSDKKSGIERRKAQSNKFLGEKNPQYKRNLSSVYWRSPVLRDRVLLENNFVCIKCKIKKHPLELDAHHIVSISEDVNKRCDLNNIACLCVKCHRAFHLLYGKKATKKDFESFMESSETIEKMLIKHNLVE